MKQEEEQPQTSGNDLDAASAYVLANRLIVIPRFPRDPVAVEQMADWLMNICQGAQIDDQMWTAHDQAAWLIQTAMDEIANWDEAQGLPALRSMFNRRFRPPPAQTDYVRLEEPDAIECVLCTDFGTVERNERIHWCVCEQAALLCRDAPQLVEILDRALQRRLTAQRRRDEKQAELDKRRAAFQPKSPEETNRLDRLSEDLRDEIGRFTRERERREKEHAKTQKRYTGPLSFLRWRRLRAMLPNWASRILRTGV